MGLSVKQIAEAVWEVYTCYWTAHEQERDRIKMKKKHSRVLYNTQENIEKLSLLS